MDDKPSWRNSKGEQVDPAKVPSPPTAFAHNPAKTGKVFDGSVYFERAKKNANFKFDTIEVDNTMRDAQKTEITLSQKIIETTLEGKSIQISNRIKGHVIQHNNKTTPNFTRNDLLFDIENILSNKLTNYKEVENYKREKHKDVERFAYYNFGWQGKKMWVVVKIWKNKGMIDSLYNILDEEPDV